MDIVLFIDIDINIYIYINIVNYMIAWFTSFSLNLLKRLLGGYLVPSIQKVELSRTKFVIYIGFRRKTRIYHVKQQSIRKV
jgi:hypothetical protein